MSQNYFDALNVIKTPVWLISPVSGHIIFANTAAVQMMGDKTVDDLRKALSQPMRKTCCRCISLS